MAWIEFNVNNYVWVRLNDYGRELYYQKPYTSPIRERDGWSKWQAWDLMQTFGPHIWLGGQVPFETTIRVENKDNRP